MPEIDLSKSIQDLQIELAAFTAKANGEIMKFGKITEETFNSVNSVVKRLDEIDVRLQKPAGGPPDVKTFGDCLREDPELQRFLKVGKGSVRFSILPHHQRIFESKTTITAAAVGTATSGVLQIEREPGIVMMAERPLTVRQALSARPTSFSRIDFVKVNTGMSTPTPQTETVAKFEQAVTFTTAFADVQTLADWIPASTQILADFSELEGFLRSELPYWVNRLEEDQLLSGSGVGQNINGLITQGVAFNTALLPAAAVGWTKLDVIATAIKQLAIANEVSPTWVMINPTDFWDIRLTKDSNKNYIFPPGSPLTDIFGLAPIYTTAMTAGNFLVGNGSPACAEIRDRMGMEVTISTEHSDYFVRNMVAVRAEKRLALVVRRPNAFVQGSFTTSP